jgi:hypothetical protein
VTGLAAIPIPATATAANYTVRRYGGNAIACELGVTPLYDWRQMNRDGQARHSALSGGGLWLGTTMDMPLSFGLLSLFIGQERRSRAFRRQ